MAKSKLKVTTSESTKDVARALDLPPSAALEWQVRHQLTEKIGQLIKKKKWTITEVAKKSGTSRARITDVVKGNSEGISIDVLLRILGALGSSVKLSFRKAS